MDGLHARSVRPALRTVANAANTTTAGRRISAALGLPAAADDRQLAFELSAPAPGFPSPDGLNIKVRIAHATGEIMACGSRGIQGRPHTAILANCRQALFGNVAMSEDEFLVQVQSVLGSLRATRKSIPARYVLDFSLSHMSVDRTSASLYLTLFQASWPMFYLASRRSMATPN